MDYPSSSQRAKWLYTPADLDAARAAARGRALKQTESTEFSASLERKLLAHHSRTLIQLCRKLNHPDKVITSSCSFLRRFYVKKSCLEVDPQGIVLTCLYLACKVEDCYMPVKQVAAVGGLPKEIILKSELVLLQGVEFDLACHCVFKALAGGSDGARGDDAARQKMETLLATDAVLLYTPGQLARYCLGVTNEDDAHDAHDADDADDADAVRNGIDRLHEEGKEAQGEELAEFQRVDKLLKAERKRLK